MGYLKRKARAFLVSPDEEFLIALGKAYMYPNNSFAGEHGTSIQLSIMLGHETSGLQTLPNLEWRAGDVVLGYIQEITVDTLNKTATVGHFATAKNYSGMGLAKRMAQGFAKLLNDNFDVTDIIFDERSFKTEYEVFFEHILRAKRVGVEPNDKWHWVWLKR